MLSRWLCWENIFYIWFLESIKPSGKLSVLQSREVREEREDERKSTENKCCLVMQIALSSRKKKVSLIEALLLE